MSMELSSISCVIFKNQEHLILESDPFGLLPVQLWASIGRFQLCPVGSGRFWSGPEMIFPHRPHISIVKGAKRLKLYQFYLIHCYLTSFILRNIPDWLRGRAYRIISNVCYRCRMGCCDRFAMEMCTTALRDFPEPLPKHKRVALTLAVAKNKEKEKTVVSLGQHFCYHMSHPTWAGHGNT